MSEGTLDWLRDILLICDGAALVGCVNRTLFYYRTTENSIYVFFLVLSVVYFVTTISDLVVVMDLHYWWARTPIVRGLVLRVPVGIVLYWMMLNKKEKK